MNSYYSGYGLGSNPANTFATVRTGYYRYYGYNYERLSLYCCSNSSGSNIGSFKNPSRSSITSGSNGFQLARYSSRSSYAGCMKVVVQSTSRYYSFSNTGIYVCEMPDHRGVTQRANIGLYTSSSSCKRM